MPVLLSLLASLALATSVPNLEDIITHDNRQPAGKLSNGVVTIAMRAAAGRWRPEGSSGREIRIEALGEVGTSLSIPAPLVRVPEGAELEMSMTNELPHPLQVNGWCERGQQTCAPIDVPPGETRHVRFKTGPAGTYHYWATTTGMPANFRASEDTQLSGAFIVDAPDATPDADRVLVITEWVDLTRAQLYRLAAQDDPGVMFLQMKPDLFFSINGRSWPHTERLRYRVGESVRWRIINLSTQVHPMHLHGFFFDVESTGNGLTEKRFESGDRPRVVTRLMPPTSTMTIRWVPERAGNWLFHCHVMTHVSPTLYVDGSPKPGAGASHDHHHNANLGMTGMVMGITVDGPEPVETESAPAAPRRMTLFMRQDPKRFGSESAYSFVPGEGMRASDDAAPVPGPPLVLKRGEPVEITLVNQLPEATAIHWHGMELDSYYDGVHGWGGHGARVTPMIAPGESFVVRFTPPRAGTFMYHTHLHDWRQLTSGLYGAMLVLEPGETFDETKDHILVIGRGGPQLDAPLVINNLVGPRYVWKAGERHRIRLINITPDDIVAVALQTGEAPVTWTPLMKDGAPVPAARRQPSPARVTIGVGETYDFEYETPRGRSGVWLEFRTPAGRWHTQARIIVR